MNNSSLPSTQKKRYNSLLENFLRNDTVCIPLVADPDAIASALAVKRLLWRKAKKIIICRVNPINRADNLAADLFGKLGAAGGHRNAARVEIPLSIFQDKVGDVSLASDFISKKLKKG